jgi:hypothetical protein
MLLWWRRPGPEAPPRHPSKRGATRARQACRARRRSAEARVRPWPELNLKARRIRSSPARLRRVRWFRARRAGPPNRHRPLRRPHLTPRPRLLPRPSPRLRPCRSRTPILRLRARDLRPRRNLLPPHMAPLPMGMTSRVTVITTAGAQAEVMATPGAEMIRTPMNRAKALNQPPHQPRPTKLRQKPKPTCPMSPKAGRRMCRRGVIAVATVTVTATGSSAFRTAV